MFKGFDKNLQCRGMQFEVGKSYTHDGEVSLCNSGFHAVEVPLDCWTYYPPTTSKYGEVDLGGVTDEKREDSKRVGNSLTVKAALDIAGLVKAQVTWTKKHAGGKAHATGDYGHAAATGDYGHAAATGDYGHAAATGDYGHAAATGYSGHAAATGNSGHAAATGNSGHAAATGNSGHAAATGNSGHAAATGNSGHAAATGYSGHAAATGDYGCAFAGFGGIAKASATGSFAIAWRDQKGKHARLIVGTPGEHGIKADTPYRVNDAGELEEVK